MYLFPYLAILAYPSQWTNKAYDFTSVHPIPFPSLLARSCQQIVRGIPWPDVFGSTSATTGVDKCSKFTTIKPDHWQDWKEDYKPDTGIVNFYHLKDTLMGHVDRSE
jgi:alkylated DNA repair protein alkB family protein 1